MFDDTTRTGGWQIADIEGFVHLIEHIQDAIVAFKFVDGQPTVRAVNEAFVSTFGYDREQVLEQSLNRFVVPEWLLAEAAELDQRTESGEINYRQVQRRTTDGLRDFLYRGIPYECGDEIDGFAIYTDLTDIVRKERQLKVLHRILRHNLRNELMRITGYLNDLIAGLDDESELKTHIEETIQSPVDNLRTLTDEATQINRVLSASQDDLTEVDAVAILRDSVKRLRRQFPDATVEADLQSTAPVVATTELRTAVDNVLENAVEHNPADSPRVAVSIVSDEADEWIDILVEDDGPLIPEDEREVVSGRAEITPRKHASGLGLWLVKWTVETYGGNVYFEESDLGGNRIRLRLRTTE